MKRGSIQDIILLISVLFITGVSATLAYAVLNMANTSMEQVQAVAGSEQSSSIYQSAYSSSSKGIGIILTGIALVFAIVLVVTAIMDWQVQAHPAYLVVSIILAAIAVFVALVYSNAFGELVGVVGGVVNLVTDFPVVSFFFQNLYIIALVAVAIVLVALYSSFTTWG